MFKQTIATRLLMWFLLISLIPLAMVTFFTYTNSVESLTKEVQRGLLAVADNKVQQIEALAKKNKEEVAVLALMPSNIEHLEFLNQAFLADGVDSPAYKSLYQQIRPSLVSFVNGYDYYDLFLISEQGDIVFTVLKESDFGTNLYSGPYKDSEIATVFKQAKSSSQVEISVYNIYAPSNKPALFVAAPIIKAGRFSGAIAVQINPDEFYQIVNNYTGLGETGETLIGYRVGNEAVFIFPLRHDPQAAFKRRATIGGDKAVPLQNAVRNMEGGGLSVDYRGKEVLGEWRYIPTFHWGLVAKIDAAEALSSVTYQRNMVLGLGLMTFVLVFVTAMLVARSISRPIVGIAQIAAEIAVGNLDQSVTVISKDEIGTLEQAFNQMIDYQQRMAKAASQLSLGDKAVQIVPQSDKDILGNAFTQMVAYHQQMAQIADNLAQGDLLVNVTPYSERDVLGNAFQQMVVNLREITTENQRQIWLSRGQTQLNDLMRGEQNIPALSENIIRFLCEYLDCQIGTLSIMKGETLHLIATFAYLRHKNSSNQFRIGEGLIGQAVLEKKMIVTTQVPPDYITINSTLGELVPTNILVSPFIHEGQVIGAIELGAFVAFDPKRLEFIQRVMENIAIAFHTTQAHMQINELLMESQRQTEKLRVQEEELRSSNEELAAQSKALRKSELLLKEKQSQLETTNVELEEKATELEKNSVALQEKQIAVDKQNQELRTAQAELQLKAEQLALTNKYKSEFLANMSHELRNPLNSILVLSHMLADDKQGHLTANEIESASIIHQAGNDLLALINEILDLAKVEAGKMEFFFEAVSLADFIDLAEQQFSHVAEGKKFAFKLNLADDLPDTIQTDRKRVGQIIKNLLSNAFKFTLRGTVSLTIQRPPAESDLSRYGLDAAHTIAFIVSDTGIGMTPEQQKIVFEAFQQADGSTSRNYGGTGLGLSICRELALKLGGAIELQSVHGQGSTFTLYLPMGGDFGLGIGDLGLGKEQILSGVQVQNPESTIHNLKSKILTVQVQNLPKSPPDDMAEDKQKTIKQLYDQDTLLTGRKILLVDDDLRNLFVLSNLLTNKGIIVETAENGKDALALLDKNPDLELVLMDVMMPVMDGYEAIKQIRKNPKFKGLPIIGLTAKAMVGDHEKCLEAGASDYLSKPVDVERLFSMLRVWLYR